MIRRYKEKQYIIGRYPAVLFKAAREERDRLYPLIDRGIDSAPSWKKA
ncbi:MAG: Arm DNA-binding domain-containing protein [Desulfovibrio sp.]|nr:Arm DNA-binding domain-containing protein [Desulfovibrio sp.]